MVDAWPVEYCNKCTTEVYPFSKKYSISTGQYYCVKCAERTDAEYLAKNTCSVCTKLIPKNEVKFVFPSKAYGQGRLPLIDRLVCAECNKKAARRTAPARRLSGAAQQIRINVRKMLVYRMMQKNPSRTAVIERLQ